MEKREGRMQRGKRIVNELRQVLPKDRTGVATKNRNHDVGSVFRGLRGHEGSNMF